MTTFENDFTRGIVHAVGRVCAEAIGAGNYVFAAGELEDTTELEPTVVDLADDFTEGGFPFVTLALGPWKPVIQPGALRDTITLQGAVWRERVPIDVNTVGLYSDRDALETAFLAHTKAFGAVEAIQSAILMGGPGIRPRSVPRADRAAGAGDRLCLTLPFTVEVKCNRTVLPQPA